MYYSWGSAASQHFFSSSVSDVLKHLVYLNNFSGWSKYVRCVIKYLIVLFSSLVPCPSCINHFTLVSNLIRESDNDDQQEGLGSNKTDAWHLALTPDKNRQIGLVPHQVEARDEDIIIVQGEGVCMSKFVKCHINMPIIILSSHLSCSFYIYI